MSCTKHITALHRQQNHSNAGMMMNSSVCHKMQNPAPELIKQTRLDAGLSAREAAELIYCTTNAWQKWESTGSDARNMHPAMWELFKIKLAQRKGGQS